MQNFVKTTSLKDRSLTPTFDERVRKLRVIRRSAVPQISQGSSLANLTGVPIRIESPQATRSSSLRNGEIMGDVEGPVKAPGGYFFPPEARSKTGDRNSECTVQTESILHFLDVVIDGQAWEASPMGFEDPAWNAVIRDNNFVSSNWKWLSVFGMSSYPIFVGDAAVTGGALPNAWELALPATFSGPHVDAVLLFFRAVLEVLFDFDVKLSEILNSRPSVVKEAFVKILTWPAADFVANAKFFTVFPMAAFLRNPLPASPPPSYGYTGSIGSALLFGGAIRRYLKARIVGGRRKDAPLFVSLLQGVKRGCAAVGESFVNASYKKHAGILGSSPPQVSFVPYFQASTKLDMLWRGTRMGSDELSEPSSSSSLFTKRSQGGARTRILAETVANLPPKQMSYDKLLLGSVRGSLQSMDEIRPAVVREQRGPEFVRTYRQLRAVMPEEPNIMEVHAVLEPLKVRLITKGPAWKMYHARKFQRATWNRLQDLPQFALTGRPLRPDDLTGLRRRTLDLGLHDLDEFCSGDYQAATDRVNILYTKLSMESALRAASVEGREADLYRAVLYEQSLVYPKYSGQPGVQQKNGQLMGSVLSFPHLCALNLIAYWIALERFLNFEVDLADLPVLINGDDILFMTNAEFDAIWREAISEIGFVLSVGKNYRHKHFLMINSEAWWYKDGVLTSIPFHNVGLLTGQSKLTGRDALRVAPIWDYYNQVMAGASNRLRAHYRFLTLNRPLLDQVTQNGQYNLFVDRLFGGLGFDLYPEVYAVTRFTPFQRKFGNFLRKQATEVSGQLSQTATAGLGIVREEKGSTALQRYHFGHYSLREYTNQGTMQQPLLTLLIDEAEERVPPSVDIRAPLLVGLIPKEKTMKIVHPRESTLRKFRSDKGVQHTSIGKLLHQERLYVERISTDL